MKHLLMTDQVMVEQIGQSRSKISRNQRNQQDCRLGYTERRGGPPGRRGFSNSMFENFSRASLGTEKSLVCGGFHSTSSLHGFHRSMFGKMTNIFKESSDPHLIKKIMDSTSDFVNFKKKKKLITLNPCILMQTKKGIPM